MPCHKHFKSKEAKRKYDAFKHIHLIHDKGDLHSIHKIHHHLKKGIKKHKLLDRKMFFQKVRF